MPIKFLRFACFNLSLRLICDQYWLMSKLVCCRLAQTIDSRESCAYLKRISYVPLISFCSASWTISAIVRSSHDKARGSRFLAPDDRERNCKRNAHVANMTPEHDHMGASPMQFCSICVVKGGKLCRWLQESPKIMLWIVLSARSFRPKKTGKSELNCGRSSVADKELQNLSQCMVVSVKILDPKAFSKHLVTTHISVEWNSRFQEFHWIMVTSDHYTRH